MKGYKVVRVKDRYGNGVKTYHSITSQLSCNYPPGVEVKAPEGTRLFFFPEYNDARRFCGNINTALSPFSYAEVWEVEVTEPEPRYKRIINITFYTKPWFVWGWWKDQLHYAVESRNLMYPPKGTWTAKTVKLIRRSNP